MSNITKLFEYNGNNVTFRTVDGVVYANATEMARHFEKKPNDYLRLPNTVKLITAIARKSRTSENQLVITRMGSSENGGGTWFHEDVALDFAQWLDIDFRLWCNDRIKELLTVGMTAMPQTIEDMVANPDLVISLATRLKEMRHHNELLAKRNEQIEPKADYYDNVLKSEGLIPISVICTDIGFKSAVTLNRKLKEMKVQHKVGDCWVLNAKYAGKGYTKNKTVPFTDSDGLQKTRTSMYWTEKGREFLVNMFTMN